MSNPLISPDDKGAIFIGSYVQVINCEDEWDELIGIVDDLLDSDLNPVDDGKEWNVCLVYFPTSRRGQEKHNLVGVNHFFKTVASELSCSDSRKMFNREMLVEIDDPEDLE